MLTLFPLLLSITPNHASEKAKLTDPKQPTLFDMLRKSETNEQANESDKEPATIQKVRSFKEDWLKYYSWLAYDKEKDYMYCTL